MPTFLESHFKIQQLESRLNKNQYLSNQCLPNYIDAQVFKALKTSDKIPKRDIYPNFYHWYVLMRQFSDRTLEIWLQNRQFQCQKDSIINEVVCVIKGITESTNTSPIFTTLTERRPQNNKNQNTVSLVKSTTENLLPVESPESPRNYIDIPKAGSHIQKKPRNQYDSVVEYIMDIKLNSEISSGFDNVRKIFQIQTVKLQSIKIISGPEERFDGYDVRVYFLTISQICEELKNKILGCSNVQTIQCKKQKRNQSL